MAFPDDHQNLAGDAAAAPADPASVGWMVKVANAVASVISALKSVGDELVSVKAKADANETEIANKAAADMSNVLATNAVEKITGAVQNTDVGKVLTIADDTPSVALVDPDTYGTTLSAVRYTGWSQDFADDDAGRASLAVAYINLVAGLPATAIVVGAERVLYGAANYRVRVKYRTYS